MATICDAILVSHWYLSNSQFSGRVISIVSGSGGWGKGLFEVSGYKGRTAFDLYPVSHSTITNFQCDHTTPLCSMKNVSRVSM